jgi:hypothetical protein
MTDEKMSEQMEEMKDILGGSLDDIKEALRDIATSLRMKADRAKEGPFKFPSETEEE